MAKEQWPKGHLSQWTEVLASAQRIGDDRFDFKLSADVQTDKEMIKIIPCPHCRRPLVVSTFYVMDWAKCWSCKGEDSGTRQTASVGQPQAGRTDPRLAKDLNKVLINQMFAEEHWSCPVHADDPEHEMELKAVSWSENYGPHVWKQIDGRMTRVQIAPGETALLQCKKCNAVITFSTTAVTQFRRQNEVALNDKQSNGWARTLGTRDDTLDAPVERDFEMPNPEEVAEDEEAGVEA